MYLKLNHQNLDIYTYSQKFVLACYKLTRSFPVEEKFSLVTQIRRAALSVHLNIAEGASRKSEVERKRFYEVARGSLIEVDAALDIASKLDYLAGSNPDETGSNMVKCFKILSGLIASKIHH
jgi:four helix bundle protein